jgi:2-oxoglutarate ferredoxin oxidoreductase subunit beta
MNGLTTEWEIEPLQRVFELGDYTGPKARWCPGCGDHGVLNVVRKVILDKQLPPEKTVVVSGIGCASRFPHYMKIYGFHGLHGRALPVACGIRSRRPDLHVFVVMGDGDCCAIGTAHWIHAIRYNMNLTILLLDNNVYGLTKNQTSPTMRPGERSNTHPRGTFFTPLNPIAVTLGVANVSFVAQSVDWNVPHLYATIRAAHEHQGAAFVRILQRCPHFTSHVFAPAQKDFGQLLLMTHPDGIALDEASLRKFPNRTEHNPSDIGAARSIADCTDAYPIGLFYKNAGAQRYDEATSQGLGKTQAEKIAVIDKALDKFMV